MKKLIIFLLIVAAGYWLYSKYSQGSDDNGVLKKVKVAVKTANLRTGPGTDFDFAVDHDAVKCQVKQGEVLRVIAEKDGWYEVRIDDDSCTAFIKQSLCEEIGAKKSKKAPKRRSSDDAGVPATSSKRLSPNLDLSPDEPSGDDGVVEEVAGGGVADEVIF